MGGFTRHLSSAVRHPGTFAGLIEKIPYLRDLGVTHVGPMVVLEARRRGTPLEARVPLGG